MLALTIGSPALSGIGGLTSLPSTSGLPYWRQFPSFAVIGMSGPFACVSIHRHEACCAACRHGR